MLCWPVCRPLACARRRWEIASPLGSSAALEMRRPLARRCVTRERSADVASCPSATLSPKRSTSMSCADPPWSDGEEAASTFRGGPWFDHRPGSAESRCFALPNCKVPVRLKRNVRGAASPADNPIQYGSAHCETVETSPDAPRRFRPCHAGGRDRLCHVLERRKRSCLERFRSLLERRAAVRRPRARLS